MNAPPSDLIARIDAARDRVTASAPVRPRVGLVLGSGLGAFAETLDDAAVIAYDRIPGWPVSTVDGHAGRLVVGTLAGVPLAIMQGRVHLYEGYEAWEVTFPVRVLARSGCQALVVTNAAGGIEPTFDPGDLMIITDHLNMQGANPCVGPNLESLGDRFFDMTYAYDPGYREIARMAALEAGTQLREGVYAGLLGPSYETPAEIRMLQALGAHAVGMSTVPEVIAARHAGLRVTGISCITNMAAGILDQPLHHEEVMETADRVRDELVTILRGLVIGIAEAEEWDRDG